VLDRIPGAHLLRDKQLIADEHGLAGLLDLFPSGYFALFLLAQLTRRWRWRLLLAPAPR
jgi:hypothetical protein